MDTTSSPAATTASNATGGARKWNCFGSGVPRVVTAVSRLTIEISASSKTDDTGPNAVPGLSSRARVRSAKCTSPPKASVIPGGVVGLGEADCPLDGESPIGDAPGSAVPVQALTSNVTHSQPTSSDRRSLTGGSVRRRAHDEDQCAYMVAGVTRRSVDVRLDEILRTACDVIAARGLGNTRTADVARAAGVSQALMFYHFETKERLLAQAFAWAAEQDLARLETLLSEDAPP